MSLKKQLNFIFLVLTTLVSLILLGLQHYQQQQLITISLEEQADSINELIADDFSKVIFLDDDASAAHILSQLKQIHTLKSAELFDENGIMQLSVQNNVDFVDSNSLLIHSKLSYQGVKLGHVEFIFFSGKLYTLGQLFKLYLAIAIFMLFTAIFFLNLFINKFFLSRLENLNQALDKTAKTNDFSIRLQPSKFDEIGQAQANFDKLIEMIEIKTTKLKYQATHDSLTGLYSRATLIDEISTSIKKTPLLYHGLCYIDLDQFKVVNDTCGHKAGDLLLIKLASALEKFLEDKPDTIFGRIGGDEFILLIKNRSIDKINLLTSQFLEVIRILDFTYMERTFPIDASIGLISYQKTSQNADDILSAADAACYEAKEKGRDRVVYRPLCDVSLSSNQQEMNLVSQIYEGLEQDNFELYLQPIISMDNISSNTHVHFETLLRMPEQLNKDQLISPNLFIPVAERYGLSQKIDYWVVNNLFKKLATEQNFMESIQLISINLSIATLTSTEMIGKLDKLFLQHKINYQAICFEITETSAASEFELAVLFIDYFKKLGVSFSLDDFGTGMSSFSYLHKFDVDFLKLDGAFVAYMENDLIKQEMVLAMSRIAKNLNKKVIAEYVETEQTIQLLQKMNIEYLQGYYFSQPKPIQYFIDQIKNSK